LEVSIRFDFRDIEDTKEIANAKGDDLPACGQLQSANNSR
jgi:hypothetical protein